MMEFINNWWLFLAGYLTGWVLISYFLRNRKEEHAKSHGEREYARGYADGAKEAADWRSEARRHYASPWMRDL